MRSRRSSMSEGEERTGTGHDDEARYRRIFDNATAGIGRTRLADGSLILANAKLAK